MTGWINAALITASHQEEIDAWLECSECDGQEAEDRRFHLRQLWQMVENLRLELKKVGLQQDSNLVSEPTTYPTPGAENEEVLQTRILPNAQVMAEWELWTDPTTVGLITQKQALERSNQKALDLMHSQGFKVILIPSKDLQLEGTVR